MKYLAYIIVAVSSASLAGEAPETIVLEDASVISCSPLTIRSGEPVTVKLGANHGKELAIKRIEGNVSLFMVV